MAYKCIKCGMTSGSQHRPINGSCGKGGGHRWVANNNRESRRWQCGKCGATQSSSSHPLVGRCPRGGGHTWHLY
jgi:DNA-directed RNA polymerase subunit RPC12/RpoP